MSTSNVFKRAAFLLLAITLTCQLLVSAAPAPKCNKLNADVIVVGAGVSGMTAAYKLALAGKCVLVVEASPRVGGLCRNWKIGAIRDMSKKKTPVVSKNVQVSIGGSFFDPIREPNLVEMLNVTGLLAAQFPPGAFDPTVFPPPLVVNPSSLAQDPADFQIFAELFGIGVQFPVLSLAPQEIQQLQGLPLELYLEMRYPGIPSDAIAKQMVRDFVWIQLSQEVNKIDTYSAARIIADVVPFNGTAFQYGANAATAFQVVGGTGQFTKILKQILDGMGVKFQVGTKVNKIVSKDDKPITVTARAGKRKKLTLKARETVIMAAPPNKAKLVGYHPPLSAETLNVMKGYESFDTVNYNVFAFFRTPWWFEMVPPRSPAVLISYAQFKNAIDRVTPDLPKIFGYAANVPPLIADDPIAQTWGVVRIFVPGRLFKSTPKSLRKDVIAYFAYFGYDVPLDSLLDVKVYNWKKDSAFVSHQLQSVASILPNPNNRYLQVNGGREGRVIFAGTNAAAKWNTWLEGAALAGNTAAHTALALVTP